MADAQSGKDTGTEAARRVADVLLCFTTRAGAIGVTDIAAEVGMSPAVAHRILQSLASRELVQWNPRRRDYELGSAALALGAHKLADLNLVEIGRPTIEWLSRESGETATLSALAGLNRVYLDQVLSPHEVRMSVEVGRAYPLHAGSSSRAILAYLPEQAVHTVLAEQLAHESERAALRAKLDQVRADGAAVSYEERATGIASTAAPLFGPSGAVIGAVSVCMPPHRLSSEAMHTVVPLVREAASRISAATLRPAVDESA